MLHYLIIVFGWFTQYECPLTRQPCPHPDRCGFYLNSCYASDVELNLNRKEAA